MKKSSFVALVLGTVSIVLFSLGVCMALIPEKKCFFAKYGHSKSAQQLPSRTSHKPLYLQLAIMLYNVTMTKVFRIIYTLCRQSQVFLILKYFLLSQILKRQKQLI